MIKATVVSDRLGVITGFSVVGHAGFAKSGSDIICAAVSILVMNTISSIEKLCPDHLDLKSDEKNGLINVEFYKRPTKECKLLLDSMILGLKSIETEYGKKYLEVFFKEEAQC